MAKRKRAGKGARLKRTILLLILLALAAMGLVGWLNAHIVHVDYADVYIQGLSPFLEGMTVLYASDFKISDESGARSAAALMQKLNRAAPDIIILGGDYTAYAFSDLLNAQTREGQETIAARLRTARRAFFTGLNGISPPGGIYAVAGDTDSNVEGLFEDCALGRVTLLENATVRATVRDTPLLIVGVKDYKTSGEKYRFTNPTDAETVIVAAHNPDSCKQISTLSDAGGSPLADLILAGHTLGGQINVMGKSLLAAAGIYQGEFSGGLYDESRTRVNMLVSTGVGTDWVNYRLGSRAQVYMVTLHRK